MKILSFVDLHGSIKSMRELKKKAKQADVIVCAGDLSIFGSELDVLMMELDKIGKKVLIVHGNHEFEEEISVICKIMKNCEFIHKKVVEYKGVSFIGWGGGGFSLVDKEFEKFAKKIKKKIEGKKTVLITHAPPYDTKLDFIYKEHHGNKSIKKFIDTNQPKLAVSGHLHETAGKKDKVKKSIVINPGPSGVVSQV